MKSGFSKNMKAIFFKQLRSNLKQPTFLSIAFLFLFLGILFAVFTPSHISEFTGTFLVLLIGMLLVMTTAGYITDDKSTMNLRFMSMAGMKPSEYCVGTWLAMMTAAVAVVICYGLIGGYYGTSGLWFLAITLLSSAVSVLLGIVFGLSKTPFLTAPIGMLLGMGPILAPMNETLERFFRFFYTNQVRLAMEYLNAWRTEAEEIAEHICQNCGEIVLCVEEAVNGDVVEAISTNVLREAFLVTLANGAVVVLLFIWMHRKYGLRG